MQQNATAAPHNDCSSCGDSGILAAEREAESDDQIGLEQLPTTTKGWKGGRDPRIQSHTGRLFWSFVRPSEVIVLQLGSMAVQ